MMEAERLLAEVRSRGMASHGGHLTPGINAIAAPIFDYRGYPATTITALGPAHSFDYQWNGAVAESLRRKTTDLSRKLWLQTTTRRPSEHLWRAPLRSTEESSIQPARGAPEDPTSLHPMRLCWPANSRIAQTLRRPALGHSSFGRRTASQPRQLPFSGETSPEDPNCSICESPLRSFAAHADRNVSAASVSDV